jgi:hypothetical protein
VVGGDQRDPKRLAQHGDQVVGVVPSDDAGSHKTKAG